MADLTRAWDEIVERMVAGLRGERVALLTWEYLHEYGAWRRRRRLDPAPAQAARFRRWRRLLEENPLMPGIGIPGEEEE